MIDGTRRASTMNFELSWNGSSIAIPKPEDVPPLGAYVKAFSNLQARLANKTLPHPGGWLQEIHSQRPARHLGTLSLIRFAPEPRLNSGTKDEEQGPFVTHSHHTALMRGPRFVVNYLEGPTIPYELAEYAGVFAATPAAEESFAKAEPPTHDEWVPDVLDDRHERTFVRVALKKIREGMEEFTGVGSVQSAVSDSVPLAAFSDLLGGLIPGERGTGTRGTVSNAGTEAIRNSEGPTGPAPGATPERFRSSDSRIRITNTGQPEFSDALESNVVRIEFVIEPLERTGVVKVAASANVMLEDGSVEADPPAGSMRPRIVEWLSGKRGIGVSNTVAIERSDSGPWSVLIAIPSDAAVGIQLGIGDEP